MKLNDTFKDLTYINNGGYRYFLHPLTDGTTPILSEHLKEFAEWATPRITELKPDILLTVEAMGLPITAVASQASKVPFVIVRKRKYELPGEIDVLKRTAYSEEHVYINGVNPGDRVVIIDDVYDTGGTLLAIATELNKHGVEVVGALFLVSKKIPIKYGLHFPVESFVEI